MGEFYNFYGLYRIIFIGLIFFSQNPSAGRLQSHLVLAACELSVAVSRYGLFWAGFKRHRSTLEPLGHSEALPWISIAVLMLLITAMRVLKKHSPVGRHKRPKIKAHVKAILQSIKHDSKTKSAVKFFLLASFVVPLIIPIATHYAAYRLDLSSDGSVDIEPTTEHLHLLGGIGGLIISEAVLFGIRQLNTRLSSILSLGFPLMLYLCVATIIYYRLKAIRPLQAAAAESLEEQIEHARIFAGPIPSKVLSVIDFYNVLNATIKVFSPNFTLEGPITPYSRRGIALNVNANVPIKVVVQNPDTGNDTMSECFCVISKLNQFHSYIIHGNETSIGIFKIYDHGEIKPTIGPVVVIMNSFMDVQDDHDRILVWEETFESDLAFFESYSAFSPDKSIIVHVPIGGVKFTYENLREIEDSRFPDDRSANVLMTEPFVVYTILITMHGERGYMDSYEIMRIDINEEAVTVPRVQHCPYVQAALVITGAAYPTMMVAFFHHFWMDSPVKLQATFMAICLISHRITRRLVDTNIKQLEHSHALILAILMGILVVWHLIVASLYFYYFKFGYSSGAVNEETAKPKGHLRSKSPKVSPISPKPSPTRKVNFVQSSEPVKPLGDL